MRRRGAGWLGLVVWLGASPAQADVLPEPAVPPGWDEHPPPRPLPPPEKEVPVVMLWLAMIGLVAAGGGTLALARRGGDVARG